MEKEKEKEYTFGENKQELYEKFRKVPSEAQKTIGAGRLKGFTDINPMWRIEKLTEEFGPCGIGWYTEITDKRIEEGANGEKVSIVDINLYIKVDDGWSKPIQGTGGSKLIAKETSGLYTSDECYKMAYTDAISIACKALGMGADIYYQKGRTKYDLGEEEKQVVYATKDQIERIKKVSLATESQIKIIKEKLNEEQIKAALNLVKKEKLEDLTIVEASSLIKNLGGNK